MPVIEPILAKSRFKQIDGQKGNYRLLCSSEGCSASSANLKKGRLAVTSSHGSDRHSQVFSKIDMTVILLSFLSTLSERELQYICYAFGKQSPTHDLRLCRAEDELENM